MSLITGLDRELKDILAGEVFKSYGKAFDALEGMGCIIFCHTGTAEDGKSKWVSVIKNGVGASVLFTKHKGKVTYRGPLENGI